MVEGMITNSMRAGYSAKLIGMLTDVIANAKECCLRIE